MHGDHEPLTQSPPVAGLSDQELLREYAATGAEPAFRQLVERHMGLVYSAALRQTGDHAMAQDVTQAVFGHPWMPPIDYVPLWQDPIRNLSIVMLPALTIGYRYAAVSMRMTRSAMLEVLREDYIRTARAKGLVRRLIINRHALKNAMLPVVTVIGIEFAFLIGGLVVTEQVFNLNGIGRLMVLSVQNQDYTLTQALVMLVVTIAVLSNLVVDLFYAWLDPRIRLA